VDIQTCYWGIESSMDLITLTTGIQILRTITCARAIAAGNFSEISGGRRAAWRCVE